MIPPLPELAGAAEAEEFFEALGVRYEPRVLAAHRLHVLRTFALAISAWLAVNPGADTASRRRAIAGALREAHDAFTGEDAPPACGAFAPGLVRLGRPHCASTRA